MKSCRFKDHRYIGDPVNAVRIFNGLGADELLLLDIGASTEGRQIHSTLVREVGEEARMPFSVGGGVHTLLGIESLIAAGAERVVICTEAVENPEFIREASLRFGTSTISVCIDVAKSFFAGFRVYSRRGTLRSKYRPSEFALKMEELGAGEVILQSIAKDGTMSGYDMEILQEISAAVSIPVVALGGAGSLRDLSAAYERAQVSALGVGSLFVYHGKQRGVLINYPERAALPKIFSLSSG